MKIQHSFSATFQEVLYRASRILPLGIALILGLVTGVLTPLSAAEIRGYSFSQPLDPGRWRIIGGDWNVENGLLKAQWPIEDALSDLGNLLYTDPDLKIGQDFDAEFKAVSGNSRFALYHSEGNILHVIVTQTEVLVHVRTDGTPWQQVMEKRINGGAGFVTRLAKRGKEYSVYVNGTWQIGFVDNYFDGMTQIGLATYGEAVFDSFTISFTLTPPCSITSVTPSQVAIPSDGGQSSVTAATSNPSCEWTLTTDVSWITFPGGRNWVGSRNVTFVVAANPGAARAGSIKVGATQVTIQQSGVSCGVSVLPKVVAASKDGGIGNLTVTTTRGDCNWTATSSANWITFPSGPAGVGTKALQYSLTQNPTATTRAARITIGDVVVDVSQDGTSPPQPFVTRRLGGYAAGAPLVVTLSVTPPANTFAYGIEETSPTGWTVDQVSDLGEFDPSKGKIKWTFLDGKPRELTYRVAVPTTAKGIYAFSGIGNLDGIVSSEIVGDKQTSPGAYHPADSTPSDWSLSLAEVLRYAAAYKKGEAWATAPNPIELSYVIRGLTLYRRGESYQVDASIQSPPAWWVNRTPQRNSLVVGQSNGSGNRESAVRQLPTTFGSGIPSGITLSITVSSATFAYGVEEIPPRGWSVSNISDGGEFDAINGKIKWTFLDSQSRVLRYSLTPPNGFLNSAVFGGRVSFDGLREYEISSGSITNPDLGRLKIKTYAGVHVTGTIGSTYIIEATDDVAGLTNWSEIGRITLTQPDQPYIDLNSDARPRRFYRAKGL